jgi:ABC-2 type transport system ATP-binding protein
VPSPDSAVRVTDVVVRFGGRAVLDGLALEAKTGELTAVLGPNGAGKTTLIRCCTDLIRPSGGTVRVLGLAAGSRKLSGRIGLMPQSAGSWSGIRAIELLRYLASLYANPLPVPALIQRLGLAECARTPYRRLSGGQQQAVNLAGALVGRPELVFLDEPTAGMDPHARRATWLLLRELRANGVTMLLTTHAMDEAEALADHVFIVDRGRVAISGTVRQLTKSGGSLESVFLTHTSARAVS